MVECCGAAADGLAALDRATVRPGSTIAHDLATLRARLHHRLGQADHAERVLRDVAGSGGRAWVEHLALTSPAALAHVAHRALGDVARF